MALTRRQIVLFFGGIGCAAETRTLEQRWRRVARDIDGTVGAAALHLGSGERISLDGGERFPLASVCKLPIAIHTFALVDEHKLALDQLIDVPRSDVVSGVSEIAERWPGQKRFPLRELVEVMVEKSDNTAVDTLLRIGGGPAAMAARFRQWNVTGIRIDRSERMCGLDAAGVRDVPPPSKWTPGMNTELETKIPPRERVAALRRFIDDPRDTGTPDATVDLLRKLFAGELLSKTLTGQLVKILEATTTGPRRIKGLLPPGTVVAHKTGTTGSAGRLNGGTNDVGVITLPGGKGRLAVAVYIKASTRNLPARENVIARIAREAFDAWSA